MNLKITFFAFIVLLTSCQSSNDLNISNNRTLTLEENDYFEAAIPFNRSFYQQKHNHDEVAALGRLLFYDTRLSKNNSIACANCHQQQKGFSDNQQFSNGLKNYQTKRNAMTLVNNAYQITHFWEGHPGQIDDHILSPVSNHIEMGMKDLNELIEKLSSIEAYNDLFQKVYGQEIKEELINEAMSTFVASIISFNSKYDKGIDVDFTNFTSAELAGKDLFFGKAKCDHCHKGDHFSASWRRSTNIGLDLNYEDEGAGGGKFKVPSLRNIALTNPYMHDGRFNSLEEVVNHYTNDVKNHPELDWTLNGGEISLTELEKEQLITFLHTLTDYQLISDKKFSNPF